ncbi:hypothetical protein [Krasilnikovia sp. MM14-A1004]|uniref:hypothetical protein n=1 Tax=Krasilnikovia sp. MM14-A1004 TaxID=3373541 RepID=UPI00399CEFDF
MRARGADGPDDETGQRNEQAGRSRRRFGRGRPEPVTPEEVPQEETGWLDDLRTAKEQRSAIGPGAAPGEARSSKSGRTAPGPDDAAAGPAPFGPPGGDAGVRPVSPPSPGATSGAPTGAATRGPGARETGRARTWQDGSGEYPTTGGWPVVEPPANPGRRQGPSAAPASPGLPGAPAAPVAGPPGMRGPATAPAPRSAPATAPRSAPPAGSMPPPGSMSPPGSMPPPGGVPPEGRSRSGEAVPGGPRDRQGVPVAPPRPQTERGPGHGRRQIEPGRGGPSDLVQPAAPVSPHAAPPVPLSGNAPELPAPRGGRAAPQSRGRRAAAEPPAGPAPGAGPAARHPAHETPAAPSAHRPAGHARPEPAGGGFAPAAYQPDGGPRHEYPLPDHREGGAIRPVSAVPGADSTGFGSRNAAAGTRGRPPGARQPVDGPRDGGGRHGLPESGPHGPAPEPPGQRGSGIQPGRRGRPGDQRPSDQRPSDQRPSDQRPSDQRPAALPGPAPRSPAGRQAQLPPGHPGPFPAGQPGEFPPGQPVPPGAQPGRAPGPRTGRAAGQARPAAEAVAPPVVPGREGVRSPAVPGRAGAMAGNTSGAIPRTADTPRTGGTGRRGGRAGAPGRAPAPQPGRPGAGGQPGAATGQSAGRAVARPPGPVVGSASPAAPGIAPFPGDQPPRHGGAEHPEPTPRHGGAGHPEPTLRHGGAEHPDSAPRHGVAERPSGLAAAPAAGRVPSARPGAAPVSPPATPERALRPGEGPRPALPPGQAASRALPPGQAASRALPPGQGAGRALPSGPAPAGALPPSEATGRALPAGETPGRVTGAASVGAPSRALDAAPAPGRAQVTGGTAAPARASAPVGTASAAVGTASAAVGAASARTMPPSSPGGAAAPTRPAAPSGGANRPPVRQFAAGAPAAALDNLREARSELRQKMRTQRRLRVVTLMSLAVVVLGVLPLIFGIRSATRDPVFNSLDALQVPSWAAAQVKDRSSGSQWCFMDCRFRERTAQSQQPYQETTKAYSTALSSAGWQRWKVDECPEQPVTNGSYTCWRRDEFTLDLWVGPPACAIDAIAAQDSAVLPSTGPDGVVPTTDPKKCTGSSVSIKVQNAITDLRGKKEPAPNPSLVGETPDPVLSDDPLLEPTPSRS